MKIRNLPVVAAGVCALALLVATGAQAQTTWTCKTFADVSTLGAKLQTLPPDAQLSAKIVVRQFQSVAQLRAANAAQVSIDAGDLVAGAKAKPIPGAQLGHMIFIDDYNLLLENQAGAVLYNSFTSAGDVATKLNELQDAEADSAKVVIEQFTAQLKHQKHTPLGQLRLDNQYLMFYLAPFAEASANACGSVGPTPTPTATGAATPTPTATAASAPTPTQVPTAISSGLGGGTPTPTAQPPTPTVIATLTPAPTPSSAQTPIPTPTQPCVQFGGQACGPTTPTPTFSSPTPTAACVQFGGFPCPDSTPTQTFAVPTPTQRCVQFGGQPCATPTP